MAGMPLSGQDFTAGANPAPGVNADGLGMAILGPTAMAAAQRAQPDFQAGNYGGVAGDLTRAAVVGGLHAVAAPIVGIHDAAASVAGHAANLVGGFIGGLAGHVAPPVTAQPAPTPVPAAPAAAAPAPARAVNAPLDEAGAAAVRQRFGLGMPVAEPAASAGGMPVAQPAVPAGFVRRTGVDNPDSAGDVVDLSGGLIRAPAAAAGGGMPIAQAEQPLAVERALNVPGGTVRRLIERAPPSQQFSMIQQVSNAEANARLNSVKGNLADSAYSEYKASQAPQAQGETHDDYLRRAAGGRNKFALQALALIAPQALIPAQTSGAFEQQ